MDEKGSISLLETEISDDQQGQTKRWDICWPGILRHHEKQQHIR
jgi:hypothetical protein